MIRHKISFTPFNLDVAAVILLTFSVQHSSHGLQAEKMVAHAAANCENYSQKGREHVSVSVSVSVA